MRNFRQFCLAAALFAACASPAVAQEPVKIGLITTLSGPAGYLGQDIRDGFQLAFDMPDLAGVKAQIMVEDDGMKPGQAKQIADRFIKTNGVKIFTGIVFGNIAFATVPDILDAGAFYVSTNTAASAFAGKGCHKNYFVASWQNDGQGESAGALAQSLGYKKVFIVAPNYPAAKEIDRGVQEILQGRGGRGEVHPARPDRFRGRDRGDPGGQSGIRACRSSPVVSASRSCGNIIRPA